LDPDLGSNFRILELIGGRCLFGRRCAANAGPGNDLICCSSVHMYTQFIHPRLYQVPDVTKIKSEKKTSEAKNEIDEISAAECL
jgi:hypothetical protein